MRKKPSGVRSPVMNGRSRSSASEEVLDPRRPCGCHDSLRYALLTVVVGFALWSVLHYMLAARTLRAALLVERSKD